MSSSSSFTALKLFVIPNTGAGSSSFILTEPVPLIIFPSDWLPSEFVVNDIDTVNDSFSSYKPSLIKAMLMSLVVSLGAKVIVPDVLS